MRRLMPGAASLAGAGLMAAAAFWWLHGLPTAGADNPDNKGISPAEKKEDPGKETGAAEKINPLSVNATCYVCHMTFVREEISRVHFKEEVTCIKCHGLSAAHANDEDVGATKPDVMYERNQVDAMCGKCHEDHDVSAVKVILRFVERRPAFSPVVCTDCHGTHKIKAFEEEKKHGIMDSGSTD